MLLVRDNQEHTTQGNLILDSLDRTEQQQPININATYNDFNQNNPVNNSFRIYNSNPNLRSREIYDSRQDLVNPQVPINQLYQPQQQYPLPQNQYQQPPFSSNISTTKKIINLLTVI